MPNVHYMAKSMWTNLFNGNSLFVSFLFQHDNSPCAQSQDPYVESFLVRIFNFQNNQIILKKKAESRSEEICISADCSDSHVL